MLRTSPLQDQRSLKFTVTRLCTTATCTMSTPSIVRRSTSGDRTTIRRIIQGVCVADLATVTLVILFSSAGVRQHHTDHVTDQVTNRSSPLENQGGHRTLSIPCPLGEYKIYIASNRTWTQLYRHSPRNAAPPKRRFWTTAFLPKARLPQVIFVPE